MAYEAFVENQRLLDEQAEIFSRLAPELDIYKRLAAQGDPIQLSKQQEVIAKLRLEMDRIGKQMDEAKKKTAALCGLSEQDHKELLAKFSQMLTPEQKNIIVGPEINASLQETTQKEDLKRCGHCLKTDASKKCGRCKMVYYCSKDCQRSHWSKHRERCQQLKE